MDGGVCAKSLQLCLTLCDSMDCSPPGSSVHEILLARILEWKYQSFPPPEDLPNPGIETESPLARALQVHFSLSEPPGKWSPHEWE